MTQYRDTLPQLSPELFLTDSGLETDLIYNEGVDLPQFAAFPLLDDAEGVRRLRNYFAGHAAIAARADVGFVFESATWRASAEWGALLGYSTDALDPGNPIAFGREHAELRSRFPHLTILGGCCGTDLRHIEQIATSCLGS